MSLRCQHDLIIIGAGMIGAACAEAAVACGLRVAVAPARRQWGTWWLCTSSLGLWKRWAGWPQAEYQHCGTLWVARSDDEMEVVASRIDALAAAGVSALPTMPWSIHPGLPRA